jgi:hypothetical protein
MGRRNPIGDSDLIGTEKVHGEIEKALGGFRL